MNIANDSLRQKLLDARQYAAVATAFTLPISTSAQAIFVSIFAVLALITLDRDRFARTIRLPAAYLPFVLFALILVGVLWSLQPFSGAIKWVGPYAKLLLIPLVLATAFTERQAIQIGYGFAAACVILLALSWASLLIPSGLWDGFKAPGVPVKDNAIQSECFALCAFGITLYIIRTGFSTSPRLHMVLALIAALFLADIFFISVSKTALLVAMSLVGLLYLGSTNRWQGLLVAITAAVAIAIAVFFSGLAQQRLQEFSKDVEIQQSASGAATPTFATAARLDFWNKAVRFIKTAPVLGHGTGSIKPLYQTLEATEPSPYGEAVPDPHNQFLHVAIQIGLVGGLILLAMWAAHGHMFWGRDAASMFGMAVLLMNLIGSLFNSHLSQVTQGMLYCLAVGLMGSLILQRRQASPIS